MDRILVSIVIYFIQFQFINFLNNGYVNSEQSQNSFKCEDDGMFPHMEDCNGYYKCKDGALTEIKCPKNTAFDPVKQKCIHFYKIAKCKMPDCSNGTLQYVPHPGNAKLYVECLDKSPKSLFACPIGLEYSKKKTPPCDTPCKGPSTFYPSEENPQYPLCRASSGLFKKIG
ncbi:uncharacterized protein [Halyomorpha halys]|uniref:uncharacterized protein isoform X2 n=1 Tax=Halyomorpha halys TaxID=286706 RepID=UPI0034D21BF3